PLQNPKPMHPLKRNRLLISHHLLHRSHRLRPNPIHQLIHRQHPPRNIQTCQLSNQFLRARLRQIEIPHHSSCLTSSTTRCQIPSPHQFRRAPSPALIKTPPRTTLINTPLQRGVACRARTRNRFSGFSSVLHGRWTLDVGRWTLDPSIWSLE